MIKFRVLRVEMTMACLVAVASVAIALPASAMTDAECASAWTAADINKHGYLTAEDGARYHAASRVGDKAIVDGKLTEADFLANCKAGIFNVRAVDAGAPLKGANSFTEGQAKDRAMANGLSAVSGLKKDNDGIWRGTAQQNGKTVNVAIDYKGNVVAN